ncbi:tetratricopeptide repeat protein [Bartonella harrusi]|uniref:Tetratricopeptide repeat protein n=1 Tax=Bartonella harrusi TaxID=2961895 RepID=A0ABY5ESA5_9HYPH|nr:tetratricopeptide repeat protein [Bartonella harrusi]UTO28152.1 tetratricopeptide repeat protein [Bartonella harrusi]
MHFFLFLKALRLRGYIFQRDFLRCFANFLFAFFSSFFFISTGYGQNPPSLPEDRPSPQLLLPLEELIPNSPPSATSDSDTSAILLEDFDLNTSSPVDRAKQRKEREISRLLKELKFCANVQEAKKISGRLQRLWSQSGSETIDLLMSWAENAVNEDDYGLALDYIDNVLALEPAYAEAWVRRAWVHIQLSDFKLAMLDLNHALEHEPRNYSAFFELGVIMEATQRPKLALKAYEKALEVYPQMRKLQERLEVLLDEQTPQAL